MEQTATNRLTTYVERFYGPNVFQYIWDKDTFIQREVERLQQSESENNLFYYINDKNQPDCKYSPPQTSSGSNWAEFDTLLPQSTTDWTQFVETNWTDPQSIYSRPPTDYWCSGWDWTNSNQDWLSEEWCPPTVSHHSSSDESDNLNEIIQNVLKAIDTTTADSAEREVREVNGDLRVTFTVTTPEESEDDPMLQADEADEAEEEKPKNTSWWSYIGY